MKIQTVRVPSLDGPTETSSEVVMLKVSGPVDQTDAIVRRAREMVSKTGSKEMLESFDWALKSNAILSDK